MNQALENAREIKWQLEVCLRGIADPETKILFLEESRRVIDRMIGNRMTLDQKSALNQLFEEIESACAEMASSYNTQPIDHLRTTFPDRVCEIIDPENLIPCLLEMRSKILDTLSQCRNDCERNKLNHFLGRDS